MANPATPSRADVPPAAAALVAQGRDALQRGDALTAQTRLEAAVRGGVPLAEVRHLLANAYLMQGNVQRVREMADDAKVAPPFRAYAARMRAAVALDGATALREMTLALQLAPEETLMWSDMARARLMTGDVAGAIEGSERALSINNNNVDALIMSGNLLRDRYGYAAALSWYDRVLALQSRNVVAMLERAATLGELGRYREMLAQTRDVQAIMPNHPRAFYLQAVMAARAGDWGLARSLIYRIGPRLNDSAGYRVLAGSVELAQGNEEQALIHLRAAVDMQPDNIVARRLLGRTLWSSGDDRGAIDTLRPIADRPDADTYTLTVMGRACEHLGDRAAAGGYLDRAAQPLRPAPTPFFANGRGPIAAMRQLVAAGRAGEALGIAQGIERAHPGSPGAIMLTGDALGAGGRWREAADAYRRASNLQFSEEAALRLIDALRRSGDSAAALAVVDVFVTQYPQSVAARLLASDAALAGKDWDRAEALLGGLRAQIGDRDATLLNNLAWVRLNQKRGGEAVALARTAYALAPNSAPVAANYGWFANAAGDRASGVALLEKAVAIAPEIPAYRARLAKARAAR
ncbi:tetratricopeptide repeat protein [Sphingomonas sp. SUN039]|uniref:tetratricopeptide repeat protein n=1 Tax=Sphingomonas sp. SUN039 TaxID=2937787 RepID=UPI002164E37E|nr:tetratricopeptide repeat protein [Sphingomonas sp. SUN039]UVO55468.1 tetratricopeptide repeat protein [Sphingomonas sp. SUN039]